MEDRVIVIRQTALRDLAKNLMNAFVSFAERPVSIIWTAYQISLIVREYQLTHPVNTSLALTACRCSARTQAVF